MQIGDTPNEVYNRREKVHKLVEMEQFNQDEQDNQPLIQEQNQNIQNHINTQQQQPIGCLARLFGFSQKKSEPKEEEYTPTELKDNYHFYDEKWFEDQINIIKKSQETLTPSENREVIHLISPDDTIEGLELQYGVPACRIRTFNNLQTNDIFYLKQIIIPNPSSDIKKQDLDMDLYMKELKIGLFLDQICQPEDKNRKVADFYLQLNDWNYEKASKEYIEDYKYELENKKKFKKVPYNKVVA